MNSKPKELSADRIKLIYEFNTSSSLFARVASSLLSESNITEAIEILKRGIGNYPDYPTAYFILAIAYAYAGNEIEAKESISKGSSFLNSASTEEFYFQKINGIISERNSLNEIKTPTISEKPLEVTLEPGEKIEDQLDLLAERLTNAKIKYNPEEKKDEGLEAPEYKGSKIASDTLAGIYISQNNYKEAISVFKELIKKNPDRADYYAAKIAELQNIIDDESGIQIF
ncbi:MAG: tetratricopeptide repeat protein [Bacteroidota bacterium]